jgi:hypothetical protein
LIITAILLSKAKAVDKATWLYEYGDKACKGYLTEDELSDVIIPCFRISCTFLVEMSFGDPNFGYATSLDVNGYKLKLINGMEKAWKRLCERLLPPNHNYDSESDTGPTALQDDDFNMSGVQRIR